MVIPTQDRMYCIRKVIGQNGNLLSVKSERKFRRKYLIGTKKRKLISWSASFCSWPLNTAFILFGPHLGAPCLHGHAHFLPIDAYAFKAHQDAITDASSSLVWFLSPFLDGVTCTTMFGKSHLVLKLASSKEGGGARARKAGNFGARAAFLLRRLELKIYGE